MQNHNPNCIHLITLKLVRPRQRLVHFAIKFWVPLFKKLQLTSSKFASPSFVRVHARFRVFPELRDT